MPELPEVETTRRGISPHLLGKKITACSVRQPNLRWPVPEPFSSQVTGRKIVAIERRGKYLIIALDNGQAFLMHLGMSGSLRVTEAEMPMRKHDHVIFSFSGKWQLRFHDPRRFGCLLWIGEKPYSHQLLDHLGPEPLGDAFNGLYLSDLARNRRAPIKNFVMDASVVVGVGNIYANEALYYAGIHPCRAAGRVSLARFKLLADAIKRVLKDAIDQGGTTLRDFVNQAGEPGYFKQSLAVYGREGEPCVQCGQAVRATRLGQRSTYYCANCQR